MNDGENRQGRPNAGAFTDPNTGALSEDGMALVRRASGLGLTKAHIARLLGMHPDTFVDRRKKFPEIEEEFELGKAQSDLTISNALYTKAKGGDMAAIRWYEMTRMNRSEKIETDNVHKHSGVVRVPVKLSEEEWAENYSPKDTSSEPDSSGD